MSMELDNKEKRISWFFLMLFNFAGCNDLLPAEEQSWEIEYLAAPFVTDATWNAEKLPPLDRAAGGDLLILKQKSRIAGSPHLRISLEALPFKPGLEAYASKLQAQLENRLKNPNLEKVSLEVKDVTLSERPGKHLKLVYFLKGSGSIDIQSTEHHWVAYGNKRGLTLSLLGRTELTTPFYEKIAQNALLLKVVEP